ncbi:hypothetical protein GDO81_023510, partial [Engystomops pustulosus]
MSINVDLDDFSELFTDANTYSPSDDASPCRDSVSTNKYAVSVIYSIVFLLNVVGNSLVIVVLYYNKQKRSSTDIYLLNLAFADLLFSITLPFWAAYRVSDWLFGIGMCKVVSILQEVNFHSGIFLLACISVDRYMAIVWATELFTEKKHWVKFITAAVWTISFILSIPTIWFRNIIVTPSRVRLCHEDLGEDTENWIIRIRIGRNVIGFFLPLLVMIFCYGSVIKTLCQTKNRQKFRAMKVILAVFFVFLICFLPYNITGIVDSLMRTGHINQTCARREQLDTALYITEVIGFTHSCINPILYAFIGYKFRQSFLTILANKGIISKDRL